MKSLVTNNVSTGFVKDLLDGANQVVVAIDKISTSLGKIGSLGAIAGIASLVNSFSKFSELGSGMEILGVFSKLGSGIASVTSAFSAGGLTGGINAIKSGLAGLVSSATVAKVAMIGLKAVLTGFAVAGIIAGVTALAKAWDNYAHGTENAVKQAKEQQTAIRDQMQGLNTQKSSLQSLAKEYDTLSSKTNKSAEDMARLSELKREIANISPELVSSYDAAGDPILKLKGSLTEYISELDKAIAKQQQLYNEQLAKEADAYLKKKNMAAKNKDQTWQSNVDAMQGAINRDEVSSQLEGVEKAYKLSAKRMAQEIDKNYQDRLSKEEAWLGKISEMKQAKMQSDEAIQAKYMAKFAENNKKNLSDSQSSAFQGFMQNLDWSVFEGNANKANEFANALDKLSGKTAFAVNQMGSYATATKDLNREFNSGKIGVEEYGKGLADIADKSGKFDMSSWGNYQQAVNKAYEDGAISLKEYESQLGIMGQALEKLTGIDASTWVNTLKNADIETAMKNATNGLNNFLESYGSSMTKLNSGDSLAQQLEKQYNDVVDFGSSLRERTIQGEVTVDWLVNQSKNGDLPTQMKTMIDAVTADNKVTEVEQKVLIAAQAEIQNEGQLTQDTISKLKGMLDGSLKIDEPIEIAGLKLSVDEAKELQKSLQEANKAGKLDFSATGIKEAAEEAKQLKEALSNLDAKGLRADFEAKGLTDSIGEINAMNSALEQIPEEKQTQFIADCGDAFNGANSLQEAIKNIPDDKKIQYNIGVEGNAELEQAKARVEALPEGVKQIIFQSEAVGIEDLSVIEDMCNQLDGKTVETILSINGIDEVLNQASTAEEALEILNSEEWRARISAEADTSGLDELTTEVDEITGEEKTVEVTANASGQETLDTLSNALQQVKGENPTNVEVNATSNDSALDGTQQKIDNLKQDTSSTHTANSEDSALDGTKQKQEEVKQDTTSTHTANSNDTALDTTKQKQEEVKQDTSSTHTANSNDSALDNTKSKQEEVKQDTQSTHTANSNDSALDETKSKQEAVSQDTQSTVDILVNGLEQLEQINSKLDGLKSKNSVNIDIKMNLADTIDNVMSRLGIGNKRTEEIKVKVTCDGADKVKSQIDSISKAKVSDIKFSITASGGDQAKSQVQAIAKTKIDSKKFTITASGGAQAKSQVQSIANTKISNKTFSITCNAGNVRSQVASIASITIPNKTFTITANVANVQASVSKLASIKISDKKFTVDCTDNATSKINTITGITIPNKTFSVNCYDNASGVLNRIRGLIASIHSKTVTITANYRTTGQKPGGLSVSEPENIGTLSVEQPVMVQATPVMTMSSVDTLSSLGDIGSPQIVDIGNKVNNNASVMANLSANAEMAIRALDTNVDLFTNIEKAINRLAKQIEGLNKEYEYAFGSKRVQLLQEQTALIKQQQQLLEQERRDMEATANTLASYLQSNGFAINADGTIDNYNEKLVAMEEHIKSLQEQADADSENEGLRDQLKAEQEEYDKLKGAADQYNSLVFEEIPEVVNEYQSLENELARIKNEIYEVTYSLLYS